MYIERKLNDNRVLKIYPTDDGNFEFRIDNDFMTTDFILNEDEFNDLSNYIKEDLEKLKYYKAMENKIFNYIREIRTKMPNVLFINDIKNGYEKVENIDYKVEFNRFNNIKSVFLFEIVINKNYFKSLKPNEAQIRGFFERHFYYQQTFPLFR